MDDPQLLAPLPPREYCCPGDRHPIDRAAHLGRLAAFYPACLGCQHRADIQQLAPPQIRHWNEILGRAERAPRFTAEGFDSAAFNVITPEVVSRIGLALAVVLWRERGGAPGPPVVLVGGDCHWTVAELLAAACDALERAGCRAIEAGALATAPFSALAHQQRTEAALWIGNASGAPHAIALRLWGRAAVPSSSPGGLDALRETYEARPDRPRRRGGSRQRASATDSHRAQLAPLFHGLRPLRFVVDTQCRPLIEDLQKLSAQSACEVIAPKESRASAPRATVDPVATAFDRRLARLGRQVLEEQAHFGAWIDGGGAACRLVDQRGAVVDAEHVCRLLAETICAQQPGATIVLEPTASDALHRALEARSANLVRGGPTRQAMCEAINSSSAVFAGGASGSYWFAGHPPVADALMAISLLLTLFSRSDQSVSEVLDAA